ncbi:MAG: glutamate synthase subunit beta [Planctomycetes bacterium]|nr:glutamate synthase subunit beta [Planctomycetota bacterium]
MSKPDDFLKFTRQTAPRQQVEERLAHYREIYLDIAEEELLNQASRCMECGVPFCHNFGCPLGNLTPECNELVSQGRWREALAFLHSTNNFPEITGRVCPAICETACALAVNDEAVAIRQTELAIVEKGFQKGWIVPFLPKVNTGKKIAVIGSGPAGLAAAQQLRRVGHEVTVFEKADRPGGILRYGIPDFKLEKWVLDRRLEQMRAEGVWFEVNCEAGVDMSATFLLKRFDAICICIGAWEPRDLPIPGRELDGIHFAMDYLIQQNQRNAGKNIPDEISISAKGKQVIIVGGGDTGNDCLGTALRQGAASVTQMEILPCPPEGENPTTPWPLWPQILRTSSSHEEGGERLWSVCTTSFNGSDGKVQGLNVVKVEWGSPDENGNRDMKILEGSDFELRADLVLLSMGFVHPVHPGLLESLGLAFDKRSNVAVDSEMMTSLPGVFAAGDAATGASLVVRAIAAGRYLAYQVDRYLMGESMLPALPPI